MDKWTAADIPDLSGRSYVVTGANSGLGAVIARELAHHGGSVIMACRDVGKGERVAADIGPGTTVRALDLADLASVRTFAHGVEDVDVLVNNAGIMAVPAARTRDGFERQFGTNHLGHFALTGLLMPKLRARVVTMSSGAHYIGRLDLDDPNWRRRRYSRWGAYGASKLANLSFAYELQRRLSDAGSPVLSMAAHPGYAATELQSHTESVQDLVMGLANRFVAQSADMGALPALFAATSPDAVGGAFYGPGGVAETWGYPRHVGSSRASRDDVLAKDLWQCSQDLTGIRFL